MQGVVAVIFALIVIAAAALSQPMQPPPVREALVGFDNLSNGAVDDATHAIDLADFDETETIADGLGPIYNAQSCRDCHQSPVSGAASQVTELRVGHLDANGVFILPIIPVNRGEELIRGRSLVNDRAICPSAAFPNIDAQEHVPDSEAVHVNRLSLSILGDGYVEAVADQTLIGIARAQCASSNGEVCGHALHVPVVEAPGAVAVGRFGWKDQHASLLSFAADAYLNEMGITSRLQPAEVTFLCNTVDSPNDHPGADGLEAIDRFARFARATKAPPRDEILAATPDATRGASVFANVGCAVCHTPTLVTAEAGTRMHGGAYTIPPALGGVTFHPYGDFLLHDVGTGDGVIQSLVEHYGQRLNVTGMRGISAAGFRSAQNEIRTAPLWGLRMRSRLMHDGASLTLRDAIARHRGEATGSVTRLNQLPEADREAMIAFLRSL